MIEGLKLTMTGQQLIARLDERIRFHQSSAAREETREARLAALTLIRDHVQSDEVYRLGEYDLRFADLLPEEDWMDCGCLDRWRHPEEDGTADPPSTAAAREQ